MINEFYKQFCTWEKFSLFLIKENFYDNFDIKNDTFSNIYSE